MGQMEKKGQSIFYTQAYPLSHPVPADKWPPRRGGTLTIQKRMHKLGLSSHLKSLGGTPEQISPALRYHMEQEPATPHTWGGLVIL